MKLMNFSIKYRFSDIVLKKKLHSMYNLFFGCNPTCYFGGMVSSTAASGYQFRSLVYIRGLIPRNSSELAEAVPIAT